MGELHHFCCFLGENNGRISRVQRCGIGEMECPKKVGSFGTGALQNLGMVMLDGDSVSIKDGCASGITELANGEQRGVLEIWKEVHTLGCDRQVGEF